MLGTMQIKIILHSNDKQYVRHCTLKNFSKDRNLFNGNSKE